MHSSGLRQGTLPRYRRESRTDRREDTDLLLEAILRNQAALDFFDLMSGVYDGKIGRFDIPQQEIASESAT